MRITVNYPSEAGSLVLRTAHDWERDLLPVWTGPNQAAFDVPIAPPHLALKPCLVQGDTRHWSVGENYVLSPHEPDPDIWPLFFSPLRGRVSDPFTCTSADEHYDVRVYLPPGYDENPHRRFPVLYMQDGDNLFFPEEAFGGREWRVDETMDRLDRMNSVRKAIVVGVSPHDRMRDYTQPGYESYGRFLTGVVKPRVDAQFRTRLDPRDTAVMGSSLGGVVSFYLAWQYPDIFGLAGCLSSTFGYRDDLFARVAHEPRRPGLIYLDSGWPRDNFDATNAMRDLLVHRGYQLGADLVHFSFPEGLHDESSWAARLHVPFQLFFGRAWSAGRASRC